MPVALPHRQAELITYSLIDEEEAVQHVQQATSFPGSHCFQRQWKDACREAALQQKLREKRQILLRACFGPSQAALAARASPCRWSRAIFSTRFNWRRLRWKRHRAKRSGRASLPRASASRARGPQPLDEANGQGRTSLGQIKG